MSFTRVVAVALAVMGCSSEPEAIQIEHTPSALIVQGKWVLEADRSTMLNPQTSGLTTFGQHLVTISDNSAVDEQQRRLHFIDAHNHAIHHKTAPFKMSASVRNSCFAEYLANGPDFEALVHDPKQPGVFYSVTEDATATGALSTKCQAKYEETGSTDYPTLLVRIEWDQAETATITHVRPIQYQRDMTVGDFPNDGIEGLALTPDGTLYLGLERDVAGKPRIFSVQLDDAFWQSQAFAPVSEPALRLPQFSSGAHPVNALDYYIDPATNRAFLLAAARNDNELWVIDEQGEWPTKRILLAFDADSTALDGSCTKAERMDNTSIEGIVVMQQTLWLINDPWKKNYVKNVRCEGDKPRYERMSPLIFSLPLNPSWFASPE